MASPSPSNRSSDVNNTTEDDKIISFSYFQKTVCLNDWWLIIAEKDVTGKGIGVAGFTSPEQPVTRLFLSAPILKIYDLFTLETTDGICVILKGFVNKTRTLENGFPSEVFNHFVIGFPPYWEEFAESCLRRGSAGEAVSREDIDRKDFEKGASCAQKNGKKAARSASRLGVANTTNDSKVTAEMQKTISKETSVSGEAVSREDVGRKDCEKGVALAQKNGKKAARSTSGLDVAGTRSRSKVAAEMQETISKKASMSGSKLKRKLTYGSPVTKERKESAAIVSPESLNCKRSRSGRCLLPNLKFWCNQILVYGADRQIIGIKEGPYAVEPSRESKSGPRRKQKRSI